MRIGMDVIRLHVNLLHFFFSFSAEKIKNDVIIVARKWNIITLSSSLSDHRFTAAITASDLLQCK